ncbi:protein DPCD-like [Acanthaster planci]|uniref:Protein DPCD n=1 Tax=Acanthaster planci TaxID=133434 RepID=A0A8B7YWN2_ACAPL|nr:protein DPCD-like [Acanthaster planci]
MASSRKSVSSVESWLQELKSAKKTALVQDACKKVHFVFTNGVEMVEEYDLKSNHLLVRKWRTKTTLGAAGKWEFEIGEQLRPVPSLEAEHLRESNLNPIFMRKDNKQNFQWRIRNLPYPIDVYSVTVDSENRSCIVRTSNKKYYKKFSIPDMDRAGLMLDQSALTLAHANNTLIITYKKPQEILKMERLVQQEIQKIKASKDGDVECNPS